MSDDKKYHVFPTSPLKAWLQGWRRVRIENVPVGATFGVELRYTLREPLQKAKSISGNLVMTAPCDLITRQPWGWQNNGIDHPQFVPGTKVWMHK